MGGAKEISAFSPLVNRARNGAFWLQADLSLGVALGLGFGASSGSRDWCEIGFLWQKIGFRGCFGGVEKPSRPNWVC